MKTTTMLVLVLASACCMVAQAHGKAVEGKVANGDEGIETVVRAKLDATVTIFDTGEASFLPVNELTDVPAIRFELERGTVALLYAAKEKSYTGQEIDAIGNEIWNLCKVHEQATCYCRFEDRGQYLSCRCERPEDVEVEKKLKAEREDKDEGDASNEILPKKPFDLEKEKAQWESDEMDSMFVAHNRHKFAAALKAAGRKAPPIRGKKAEQQQKLFARLDEQKHKKEKAAEQKKKRDVILAKRERDDALKLTHAEVRHASALAHTQEWKECFLYGKCVYDTPDPPPPPPPKKPLPPPPTGDWTTDDDDHKQGEPSAASDDCDHKCSLTQFGNYTICYAHCELDKCDVISNSLKEQLEPKHDQLDSIMEQLATLPASDKVAMGTMLTNKQVLLDEVDELNKKMKKANACKTKWHERKQRWANELVEEMNRLKHLRARKKFEDGDLSGMMDAVLAARLAEINATLKRLRQRYLQLTGEASADPQGDMAAATVLSEDSEDRQRLSSNMKLVEKNLKNVQKSLTICTKYAEGDKGVHLDTADQCSDKKVKHLNEFLDHLIKRKTKMEKAWQHHSECRSQHKAAMSKLKILEEELATAKDGLKEQEQAKNDVEVNRLKTKVQDLESDVGIVRDWVESTHARGQHSPKQEFDSRQQENETKVEDDGKQQAQARLARCLGMVRGTKMYKTIKQVMIGVDPISGVHRGVDMEYMEEGKDGSEAKLPGTGPGFLPKKKLKDLCLKVSQNRDLGPVVNNMLLQVKQTQLEQKMPVISSLLHRHKRAVEAHTMSLLQLDLTLGKNSNGSANVPMEDAFVQTEWELDQVQELIDEYSKSNRSRSDLLSLQLVRDKLAADLHRESGALSIKGNGGASADRFAQTSAHLVSTAGMNMKVHTELGEMLGMGVEAMASLGRRKGDELVAEASKMKDKAMGRLMNAALSCLCYDVGAEHLNEQCGPEATRLPFVNRLPSPLFPLETMPAILDGRALARKKIGELHSALMTQKKELIDEAERRSNQTSIELLRELNRLRKLRHDLRVETDKYLKWQLDHKNREVLGMKQKEETLKLALKNLQDNRGKLLSLEEEERRKRLEAMGGYNRWELDMEKAEIAMDVARKAALAKAHNTAKDEEAKKRLANEKHYLEVMKKERSMRGKFEAELGALQDEKKKLEVEYGETDDDDDDDDDEFEEGEYATDKAEGGRHKKSRFRRRKKPHRHGLHDAQWEREEARGDRRGGLSNATRWAKHWQRYSRADFAGQLMTSEEQFKSECARNATFAKLVLDKERRRVEEERRRWEEAVVRLSRPKTCKQLQGLATGGTDGVYTVFPPEHTQMGQGGGCVDPNGKGYSGDCARLYRGVQVYCDMTTDGGGWTLVGYADKGHLGSKLGVSHGSWDPRTREGSANINALWIAQASSEVALAWNADYANGRNTLSRGNIASYSKAINYDLPNPSDQTLAPAMTAPRPCSSTSFSPVRVGCLVGECNMPKKMYTGTNSMGVCGGHAYGVVSPEGTSPICDWPMDDQGYTGVYMSVDDGSEKCVGIADQKRQKGDAVLQPTTMSIWMR
jgi:hypothetical protein